MKKPMKALAMLVVGCAAVLTLGVHVRADAPAGHFTDLGDGTVRDNLTGLVWQQNYSASSPSQPEAAAYCASQTTAGGGWRLPDAIELQTLVDDSRVSPAIDPVAFPGTPPENFWSSTAVAGGGTNGWVIYFLDGVAGYFDVTSNNRVRCVR
jgi:hypothetical protein